ncbi:MAG: hypothetical protein PHG29_02875 [Prolixibacteraceae bacterium]|jgi:hypothetical protein|nr:hypothetical protein [Prolixibacteraceae bacterium]NLO03241.1 hypothetical protein [Bacteroidales bacterium]
MTEIKRDSTINELTDHYKAWSLKVFNYSFSHETFIVPWQIDDNKQKSGSSEVSDLTKE